MKLLGGSPFCFFPDFVIEPVEADGGAKIVCLIFKMIMRHDKRYYELYELIKA